MDKIRAYYSLIEKVRLSYLDNQPQGLEWCEECHRTNRSSKILKKSGFNMTLKFRFLSHITICF